MAITKKHQRQRQKKYNQIKRLERLAAYYVENIFIGYTDGLAGCVMIDIKRRRIVPPESQEGRTIITALSRPHKWSCFIAVFGRTPFDEYMKAEQVFSPARYFQADLAPIFEEHHAALMKRVPDHQRCGVGWLADPNGREISEEVAGAIFERLEAWG